MNRTTLDADGADVDWTKQFASAYSETTEATAEAIGDLICEALTNAAILLSSTTGGQVRLGSSHINVPYQVACAGAESASWVTEPKGVPVRRVRLQLVSLELNAVKLPAKQNACSQQSLRQKPGWCALLYQAVSGRWNPCHGAASYAL